MVFKTSRLYFLGMLFVAILMSAAAGYVGIVLGEGDPFKRFIGYSSLVLFGIGALALLVMLVSRAKTIEVSAAGLGYSAWAHHIVQWDEIENVESDPLGTSCTLKFKNKHHPVFYLPRPLFPLWRKKAKEGEYTISFVGFPTKIRIEALAAIIVRWTHVATAQQLGGLGEDFADIVDRAFEVVVHKIAKEEGSDPEVLMDELDTLMDDHVAEVVGMFSEGEASFEEFEIFVRSLHREKHGSAATETMEPVLNPGPSIEAKEPHAHVPLAPG